MTKFFGMMAVVATLLMGSVAVAEVADGNKSRADTFCDEINKVAGEYGIQDAKYFSYRFYGEYGIHLCRVDNYRPPHVRATTYWNGETYDYVKRNVGAEVGSDAGCFDNNKMTVGDPCWPTHTEPRS